MDVHKGLFCRILTNFLLFLFNHFSETLFEGSEPSQKKE